MRAGVHPYYSLYTMRKLRFRRHPNGVKSFLHLQMLYLAVGHYPMWIDIQESDACYPRRIIPRKRQLLDNGFPVEIAGELYRRKDWMACKEVYDHKKRAGFKAAATEKDRWPF